MSIHHSTLLPLRQLVGSLSISFRITWEPLLCPEHEDSGKVTGEVMHIVSSLCTDEWDMVCGGVMEEKLVNSFDSFLIEWLEPLLVSELIN